LKRTSEIDAFFAAIRANPADDAPRLAFADWVEEYGGDDAADSIRANVCQGCKAPRGEYGKFGMSGRWYKEAAIHQMNHYDGAMEFDYDFRMTGGLCVLYDGLAGWLWVCPVCRRKAIAAKAHASRRAKLRAAILAKQPGLFAE